MVLKRPKCCLHSKPATTDRMKAVLIIVINLITLTGYSQSNLTIETSDISNFWVAYDRLESATSYDDSIKIIQEDYIDKSTKYFKEFIELRGFSAEEYVQKLRLYPKFWKSIRPLTENIENRIEEIASVFEQYRIVLPEFTQPKVCFAIGCLRTGGTTTEDLILIGAEMAVANRQIDTSELSGWLKHVIGNAGDIVSIIAHETIHTQQYDNRLIKLGNNLLLEQTMKEGIADFFTTEILGLQINKEVFEYGYKNNCRLVDEFISDLQMHPKAYKRWLYQGEKSKKRPADLGYFIGYQIAKKYYEKSENKAEALQELLNIKKYKKIFKQSNFKESCR